MDIIIFIIYIYILINRQEISVNLPGSYFELAGMRTREIKMDSFIHRDGC
jgi:hypothetical protein